MEEELPQAGVEHVWKTQIELQEQREGEENTGRRQHVHTMAKGIHHHQQQQQQQQQQLEEEDGSDHQQEGGSAPTTDRQQHVGSVAARTHHQEEASHAHKEIGERVIRVVDISGIKDLPICLLVVWIRYVPKKLFIFRF
uniref:Uncharacterized protein n=1 Tax=Leersia perrieri TaxID=77586 RepID=A0A0D9VCQ9_9ORYZ